MPGISLDNSHVGCASHQRSVIATNFNFYVAISKVNKELMGKYKNGRIYNYIAWMFTVFLVFIKFNSSHCRNLLNNKGKIYVWKGF